MTSYVICDSLYRFYSYVDSKVIQTYTNLKPSPVNKYIFRLYENMYQEYLVHPSAPVLLTKNGPLGTCICCPAAFERVGLNLTHLKFTQLHSCDNFTHRTSDTRDMRFAVRNSLTSLTTGTDVLS